MPTRLPHDPRFVKASPASAVPAVATVAILIRHRLDRGRILVVRRPDGPEEELPDLWGLPAATCQPGEPPEAAARRAARQKLGLEILSLRPLASGSQERPQATLSMILYEAIPQSWSPTLPSKAAQEVGSTYYTGWDWAPLAVLEEGAARGSLCCALALEANRG